MWCVPKFGAQFRRLLGVFWWLWDALGGVGIHFRFKLLEVRCHDSMIPDTMILDISAIYASLFREMMVATPVIAVPGLQLVAVQGSNTALGLRWVLDIALVVRWMVDVPSVLDDRFSTKGLI